MDTLEHIKVSIGTNESGIDFMDLTQGQRQLGIKALLDAGQGSSLLKDTRKRLGIVEDTGHG